MESSDDFGRAQFAANLRSRRDAANLTQEEFGHRAGGMHSTEVSRLEREKRDPRLSTIVRLGRGFGIPPGELLDRIS